MNLVKLVNYSLFSLLSYHYSLYDNIINLDFYISHSCFIFIILLKITC